MLSFENPNAISIKMLKPSLTIILQIQVNDHRSHFVFSSIKLSLSQKNYPHLLGRKNWQSRTI